MTQLPKLSLTKDEKVSMLLLNDTAWARLKKLAKNWLNDDATINLLPEGNLLFLRDMPAESWFRQAKLLDLIREEHGVALSKKRKDIAANNQRLKRNAYMRNYMKRRRDAQIAERMVDNARTPEEDEAATRELVVEEVGL